MGRRDHLVKLIAVTHTTNAQRNVLEIEAPGREVFAEKKSIERSEFYQAAATGFRPKLIFIVWTREYNDEQRLEFKGKKYDIIRTFEPNSEDTELFVQGLVNIGVQS